MKPLRRIIGAKPIVAPHLVKRGGSGRSSSGVTPPNASPQQTPQNVPHAFPTPATNLPTVTQPISLVPIGLQTNNGWTILSNPQFSVQHNVIVSKFQNSIYAQMTYATYSKELKKLDDELNDLARAFTKKIVLELPTIVISGDVMNELHKLKHLLSAQGGKLVIYSPPNSYASRFLPLSGLTVETDLNSAIIKASGVSSTPLVQPNSIGYVPVGAIP